MLIEANPKRKKRDDLTTYRQRCLVLTHKTFQTRLDEQKVAKERADKQKQKKRCAKKMQNDVKGKLARAVTG